MYYIVFTAGFYTAVLSYHVSAVICKWLNICYVYFAPLPRVCKAGFADSDKKINQRNVVPFSVTIVMPKSTPRVDQSVSCLVHKLSSPRADYSAGWHIRDQSSNHVDKKCRFSSVAKSVILHIVKSAHLLITLTSLYSTTVWEQCLLRFKTAGVIFHEKWQKISKAFWLLSVKIRWSAKTNVLADPKILPVPQVVWSAKTSVLAKASQGELDLCRYLYTGIGPAIIHRSPQLVASLVPLQNYETPLDQPR